jgi:hypothetical protein
MHCRYRVLGVGAMEGCWDVAHCLIGPFLRILLFFMPPLPREIPL